MEIEKGDGKGGKHDSVLVAAAALSAPVLGASKVG